MNSEYLNIFTDLKHVKGPKEKYNLHYGSDDVWGDFLGLPHGTTAAVIGNKILVPLFSENYACYVQ